MLKTLSAHLIIGLFLFLHTVNAGAGSLIKLDAAGNELPDSAQEWQVVHDTSSGLFWEVKTKDGSVHDAENVFSWKEAKKKFIKALNEEKFGGYEDWRIPHENEIKTIFSKAGGEPYINTDFFPNTAADAYWNWYICGDGSFVTQKMAFGEIKKKEKRVRVRAVRGNEIR